MSVKGNKEKALENSLWEAADKLRGNLEAAEFKHVMLGLIFLKYISDSYIVKKNEFMSRSKGKQTGLFDKKEDYWAEGAYWIPEKARWDHILGLVGQDDIAKSIDEAMSLIEGANPTLENVLPKNYSRADIDNRLLGELLEIIDSIGLTEVDHGADDILGRVYEYFLGKFAAAEGRGAGEFYTPRSVVNLLVNMLQPYEGSVYDPCCGTGGMFVQSYDFVEANGGDKNKISIYGQEFVATTWRLANMNMQLRGLNANLGKKAANTFFDDQHPDLLADYIIANPPFNMSDWGQSKLTADKRWKFGLPPRNNANFAWVQHMASHLSDKGLAGFVLANGSLTSNQSGEGLIRKNIIEADLVDCVVQLPSHLFYSTQISVCIWILAKDKSNRLGKTLFIDARNMGVMVDKVHRELQKSEIQTIAKTYANWRAGSNKYKDTKGFCSEADIDGIATHKYALVPGRYVGFSKRPTLEELRELNVREDIKSIEELLNEVDKLSRAAVKVMGRVTNG